MPDFKKIAILIAVVVGAYFLLQMLDKPVALSAEAQVSVGPNHHRGQFGGEADKVGAYAPVKKTESERIEDINTDYMNLVKSDQLYKQNVDVLPPPQISNQYSSQGDFAPVDFAPSASSSFAQVDCFPKDQLMSSDLLPRDGAFEASNPKGQGQLSNRNFFESGYHAGLNTQSNSLRNGNQQLRSDPLIPRKDVGPWLQSTYEADTNRREFEIGI